MIKSAAELMRSIKLAQQSDPTLRALEEKVRTGRPRGETKRCWATKFGTCFQPVMSKDGLCRNHMRRLKIYGDVYAGKPMIHWRDRCRYCHGRRFLRNQMDNRFRRVIVEDHYGPRTGEKCPGSGYAPVRVRKAER